MTNPQRCSLYIHGAQNRIYTNQSSTGSFTLTSDTMHHYVLFIPLISARYCYDTVSDCDERLEDTRLVSQNNLWGYVFRKHSTKTCTDRLKKICAKSCGLCKSENQNTWYKFLESILQLSVRIDSYGYSDAGDYYYDENLANQYQFYDDYRRQKMNPLRY